MPHDRTETLPTNHGYDIDALIAGAGRLRANNHNAIYRYYGKGTAKWQQCFPILASLKAMADATLTGFSFYELSKL